LLKPLKISVFKSILISAGFQRLLFGGDLVAISTEAFFHDEANEARH
jgi:hypothetical protein